MSQEVRAQGWLPSFRRSLRYLRPHSRPLVWGLIAAVGVSVFYVFSISSIIPFLKVMFSEDETLVQWIHRIETERRLDINLLPADNPQGLEIAGIQPDSRSSGVLRNVDYIVSLDGNRDASSPGSHALTRAITENQSKRIENVVVQKKDGTREVITLELRSYHWWSSALRGVAALIPQGKDPASKLRTLTVVMISLFVIALLGGLCRLANEGLVAIAVQRGMHDLRSKLADHVLRLPLDWHGAHPPGDTIGRFATDLSKVEVGVMTLFGKTIREPLKAVGVIILTVLIDWQMLLIALMGVPIGAIVMATFGRQVKRAQKKASQSWGRLLDHLGEKLAGIRIVKSYGMEQAESRRFEHEGRTLTKAQTHIELVDAATNPALETLAVLGVVAFVIYGGSRVFTHDLEPHLFFAATVCLGGIFDPVRKMGNVNNRLQQADVSARRLFDLMDLKTEEPPRIAADATPLPRFRRAIEFRDVSFAYPSHPDKLVVDGIDLTVRKGQVVALVGPNGSGKTTLMSLMLRFYQPARGRILIDGRDIAGATLESLRCQIGLVTQDSVVFSGTVRENIAYGADGEATDEMVARAARDAHIDDFVQTLKVTSNGEQTAGYNAHITARSLSGGQRQRIALARAILRDPPILVLDEATSQIDSESERKIQEALEDVTRDRTTFIIAHRFSTIARADVIVVLNEGRIVASGRHAELIDACPFYVTLCETQFASGIREGGLLEPK